MSDVKWIKISTNVFDDEKIRLLETLPDSDTLLIVWFKLLAMAGRCNDCGMIYLSRDIPYNEEMLSTIMRRPVNTVRMALNEFQKLGMIEVINNFIAIINWNKHQTLDKYEVLKEQNRKRKQIQRAKLKEITDVTGQSRDVTQEIRLDKTRLDKNREKKRILPKDVNDVIEYAKLKNMIIDPRYFYEFFTESNWVDTEGKQVYNFKQKMQTWNKREVERQKKNKREWHMEMS